MNHPYASVTGLPVADAPAAAAGAAAGVGSVGDSAGVVAPLLLSPPSLVGGATLGGGGRLGGAAPGARGAAAGGAAASGAGAGVGSGAAGGAPAGATATDPGRGGLAAILDFSSSPMGVRHTPTKCSAGIGTTAKQQNTVFQFCEVRTAFLVVQS